MRWDVLKRASHFLVRNHQLHEVIFINVSCADRISPNTKNYVALCPYVDMRKGYYASEQRWENSLFWQRRGERTV